MMAVNDQDQPAAGPVVIGGLMAVGTAQVLKAISPANSVYTFTTEYTYHWRNGPLSFRRNFSYTLDPQLKAVLLAAHAPMMVA